jgi:hypothetical protein
VSSIQEGVEAGRANRANKEDRADKSGRGQAGGGKAGGGKGMAGGAGKEGRAGGADKGTYYRGAVEVVRSVSLGTILDRLSAPAVMEYLSLDVEVCITIIDTIILTNYTNNAYYYVTWRASSCW